MALSREQQHIERIRRKRGFCEHAGSPADDPECTEMIEALTESNEDLEEACQLLSKKLYSKATHFLLEMIQNADDTSYPKVEAIVPTLHISVDEVGMLLECNEEGFTEANVESICRIGKSTKKAEGFTGEKGIGFKSVFKVAHQVWIQSRGYSFKFDIRQKPKLGMITPINADFPRDARAGTTQMYLQFAPDTDVSGIMNEVRKLSGSLLLFLRKLRCLKIRIETATLEKITYMRKDRKDSEDRGGLTDVEVTRPGICEVERYLILKSKINLKEPRDGREQDTNLESEICLAFPLRDDWFTLKSISDVPDQPVCAFLPVRTVGFKFLIQADFVTSANRQDIQADSQWNRGIRDSIADLFAHNALSRFRMDDKLKFYWPLFLPAGVSDEFFQPLANSIVQKVKWNNDCIACEGGAHRWLRIVRCVGEFVDSNNKPLVSSAELRSSFRWSLLHSDFPVLPLGILKSVLGLCDLDFYSFLTIMLKIDKDKSKGLSTSANFEHICYHLCRNLNFKESLRQDICSLKIARKLNGEWTCVDRDKMFFLAFSGDVPANLPITFIRRPLDNTHHSRLLTLLGIRDGDADTIVSKIRHAHHVDKVNFSVATLHSHLSFVFRHGGSNGFRLWLADQDRYRYSDLSSSARFLHSMFYTTEDIDEGDWLNWLKERRDVATSPRLLESGLPSEEFQAMLDRLGQPEAGLILQALRTHWPNLTHQAKKNSSFLDHIRRTMVRCQNGRLVPIKDTYLPTHALKCLANQDLDLLPTEDPDNIAWRFLRDLGVSFEIDAGFYLKSLQALQQSNSADAAVVMVLYKQLEARFHELADSIRSAFDSQPLFFVNDNWYSKRDVVWHGPGTLKLSVRRMLKPCYPFLNELFVEKLEVAETVDACVVVEEFDQFREALGGNPLTDAEQDRLRHLLSFLESTLRRLKKMDVPPPWLLELLETNIFPVSRPGCDGITLGRSDSCFMIDSRSLLKNLFEDSIAILTSDILKETKLDRVLDYSGLRERTLADRVEAHGRYEAVKPDPDLTRELRARSRLLRRYAFPCQIVVIDSTSIVLGEPMNDDEASRIELPLRKITVLVASSIVVHYTLRVTPESDPIRRECSKACHVALSPEKDALFIYLTTPSRSSQDQLFIIAAELAQHLRLTVLKVGSLLALPPDHAERLLTDDGVPHLVESSTCSEVDKTPQEASDTKEGGSDGRDTSRSDDDIDLVHAADRSEPRGVSPVDVDVFALPAGMARGSMLSDFLSSEQGRGFLAQLESQAKDASRGLDMTPRIAAHGLQQPAPDGQARSSSELQRTDSSPLLRVSTPARPQQLGSMSEALFERMPTTANDSGSHRSAQRHIPDISPRWQSGSVTAFNPAFSQTQRVQKTRASRPRDGYSDQDGESIAKALSQLDLGGTSAHAGDSQAPPSDANSFDFDHDYFGGVACDAGTGVSNHALDAEGKNHLIGFLGEQFVFHMLSKALANFGPDNWTSELRTHAGFPEPVGHAPSDFVYEDAAGELPWAAASAADADNSGSGGRSPITYLIEVKTTPGACGQPFFMSRRQLETARALSSLNPDRPPAQVYVIIRVYELRLSQPVRDGRGGTPPAPRFEVLVDPHAMLARGALQIVPDKVAVCMAM